MTTIERTDLTGRVNPLRRSAELVWDAVTGFIGEFVWGSVQQGAIRLRGMSPAMRAVVVLTTMLLVLTTLSFAAPDLMRTGQDLLVISNGTPGRGTLVPAPLVPATFAILAIACALLLAGALHAPPALRLAVLFLYSAVAIGLVGLASALETVSRVPVWWAWALIAGVFVTYAAGWRRPARPAPEFAVLVALVTGTFALSAWALFRSDEITGSSFALQQLNLLLRVLVGLSLPLLFVAGLDTIGFGLDAATWAVRFTARRLTRSGVYLALAAIVAWRLFDLAFLLQEQVSDRGARAIALEVVGASAVVAGVLAFWFVVQRFAAQVPEREAGEDTIDQSSAKVRLPLGIAYAGVTFLLVPVLLLFNALTHIGVSNDARVFEAIGSVAAAMGSDATILAHRVMVGAVMLAVGAWLARRGNPTLAVFVGAIGVHDLVTQLFANVDAFSAGLWQAPQPLDVAWNAVFAAAGLWWTIRRELTPERAARLLLLILLAAMLSHFDVVADPLTPVLGFGGMGLVVFGLVWGFLTGGGWANEHSPGFPRPSRVFLYLGYALLSVALLNWFSVSHDVAELSRMESISRNGVTLLGYPLLYALFVLVLAGALKNRPVQRSGGGSESAEAGAN